MILCYENTHSVFVRESIMVECCALVKISLRLFKVSLHKVLFDSEYDRNKLDIVFYDFELCML